MRPFSRPPPRRTIILSSTRRTPTTGISGLAHSAKVHDAWFNYWLRGEGPLQLAEATVFETGSNQWREYDAWPPRNGVSEQRIYFGPRRTLSFVAPSENSGYDEYVSDPANPVPY